MTGFPIRELRDRDAIYRTDGWFVLIRNAELLALLDAVEAAQLEAVEHGGALTLRLADALARFDFGDGEDTA